MSYWLSRWWLLEWLIREVRAIERVTHWPERGGGCGHGGGRGGVKESDRASVRRRSRECALCISTGESVDNKTLFLQRLNAVVVNYKLDQVNHLCTILFCGYTCRLGKSRLALAETTGLHNDRINKNIFYCQNHSHSLKPVSLACGEKTYQKKKVQI